MPVRTKKVPRILAAKSRPKASAKPRKAARLNLMQEQVSKHLRDITRGVVLCIDPSSGSYGSMPGYAIYVAGALSDCGTIQIPLGVPLHERLRHLAASLRMHFEKPDILVTEFIPPFIMAGRRRSVPTELHRSIGALFAATSAPVIEVSPMTWRKHLPPWYVKSDSNDAVMLGHAVLAEAHRQLGTECPILQDIDGRLTCPPGAAYVNTKQIPHRPGPARGSKKRATRNRGRVA